MISKELISIYNKYAPLLDKGDIYTCINESDMFTIYRHFHYLTFKVGDIGDLILNTTNDINKFCIDICSNIDISKYEKMYDALKHKVRRYNKSINAMLLSYNYSFFITLTYRNLEDCDYGDISPKALKSQLKNAGIYEYKFICNRDYGSVNERFHLHLLLFSNDNVINVNWSYGFFKIDFIEAYDVDKVNKYINKLSYHIFKVRTKYQNILNL